MALTTELLDANAELASLTEDQKKAITVLSANDENQVIASRIGELHGQYDKDVKSVTGIDKNQGEKTYDYVKRVLADYKGKAAQFEELSTKVTALERSRAELETKIREGKGNEETSKKLRDAESALEQLRTKYEDDRKSWESEKGKYDLQITGIKVSNEFDKAISGLKFKAGYSPDIQSTLISATKEAILNQYGVDWVDTDGTKTMVFRTKDDKAEIVRNKNNALQPYTVKEMMAERLKDVLDTGRKGEGTGTGPKPDGDGGDDFSLDLSGTKTQTEASDKIQAHLMAKGLTRGSTAFSEAQTKLWKDNNISKLPMR